MRHRLVVKHIKLAGKDWQFHATCACGLWWTSGWLHAKKGKAGVRKFIAEEFAEHLKERRNVRRQKAGAGKDRRD